MMVLDIKLTVSKKDWRTLVGNFLPSTLADFYSFAEAMHIVGALVNLANNEMESTDPQIDEVAVLEDGVYIESHKGLMLPNVVEYDQINDRYLVKCSCLENNYLTPIVVLSFKEKD